MCNDIGFQKEMEKMTDMFAREIKELEEKNRMAHESLDKLQRQRGR